MRPASEVHQLREELGDITPYMDPVLRTNKRSYVRFLRRLQSRGLIRCTLCPEGCVTVFFIAKKNDQLRMVVDARRTNRLFKAPPGVDLCTAETFARVEIEVPVCKSRSDADEVVEQLQMWIGMADISDCFHRLGISSDLSRYFCLDPVAAQELDVVHCEGHDLAKDELVLPCLAALPMGFNWSMFWAQSASENQLASVSTLGPCRIIRSRDPALVFSESSGIRYYLYVDNLGVLGLQRAQVAEALKDTLTGFGSRLTSNSCRHLAPKHWESRLMARVCMRP